MCGHCNLHHRAARAKVTRRTGHGGCGLPTLTPRSNRSRIDLNPPGVGSWGRILGSDPGVGSWGRILGSLCGRGGEMR
uniref:Uncharacterized protein n=1 Tax=Knipowitschia caucasica TaxID=637954 RepID=A0AAV2LUV6_KNICA